MSLPSRPTIRVRIQSMSNISIVLAKYRSLRQKNTGVCLHLNGFGGLLQVLARHRVLPKGIRHNCPNFSLRFLTSSTFTLLSFRPRHFQPLLALYFRHFNAGSMQRTILQKYHLTSFEVNAIGVGSDLFVAYWTTTLYLGHILCVQKIDILFVVINSTFLRRFLRRARRRRRQRERGMSFEKRRRF